MAQQQFPPQFAYEVPPYFGGDQLAQQGGSQFPAPFAEMTQTGVKKNISVDVDQFIRTRDALSSAYMSLSSSIDKAVKAYIDHTNVVLAGDSSLNVSYLTQPFDQLANTAQLAQQALHAGPQPSGQLNGAQPAEAEVPAKKGKRQYKQRDPNAPKRPLTAYFRYLQEQRAPLAAELAAAAGGQPQKPGDLSKEATDRWNKLSKEEQQPYRDAYQRALKDYDKDVSKYKAAAGIVDTKAIAAAKQQAPAVVAGADEVEEDETDEDETSSEEDDDEDEEEEEAPAPPPPAPKAASPDVTKKTPKSAKKAKQETVPTPQTFSSLGNHAPAPSSSPERKRKADAAPEAENGKKKRGRKVTAQADAPTPAPVAQMTPASEEPTKKKKKRKVDA